MSSSTPTHVTVVALTTLLALALAADIEQEWVISYKTVHPDGYSKVVPVVNGEYPGPTLRGRVGQTVRIVVHNALMTDTTSIHWHGLKQIGTVWSDGVPGVTQCAIGPGDSFTYEFTLDAPGTLWWHSHSGLQKSSLYGAMIIHGDKHQLPSYDYERILLLNDWFHDSSTVQVAGLLNPSFRWVGDPDALLINGQGEFNCSTFTADECDQSIAKPFVLHVKPSTTYRLRLIGASSLAFLNFGIEGHVMSVVEAETTLTKPMKVKFLDIGGGQSYSVLLRTKSVEELSKLKNNNGNFWMQLNMRHRKNGPTGYGILRYSLPTTKKATPRQTPSTFPSRSDVNWSLRQARRLKSLSPVHHTMPSQAHRVVTVLGTQNRLGNPTTGRLVWTMNNISFTEPKTPILHAVKLGIRQKYVSAPNIPTPFNYSLPLSKAGLPITARNGTNVLKVKLGEVVDFVFQNTVSLSGAEEVHPWHLHLGNMWILGYGDNHATWTPSEVSKYKKFKSVERNTFNLYPNSWTAIRVRFDNAGIALFHCHILPHLVMGMGFAIQIGEPHQMPPPPKGTQFCGAANKMMSPRRRGH